MNSTCIRLALLIAESHTPDTMTCAGLRAAAQRAL